MSVRGDMTVETFGMSRSSFSSPASEQPAVGVREGRMGRGIAVPAAETRSDGRHFIMISPPHIIHTQT